MSPKLVVGLTGGIGSGKSTVASLFAQAGTAVVDTDDIAHSLTQPNGAAMPAIVTAFGASYADVHGGLDRAAMRSLVFSEPQERRRLEEILHPMILDVANEQLAQATGPYAILVAPLLIESGAYQNRVDRILVVDCDERTQLARTMVRSGLGEDAVRAIIASQAPRTERLAFADDVIDNSGDQARLQPEVESLHRQYSMLAKRKAEQCSK